MIGQLRMFDESASEEAQALQQLRHELEGVIFLRTFFDTL
jgi:hypothetical protein